MGVTIELNGSGKLVVGNQTQTVNTITSNGARDLKLEANLELVVVSLLKMEALGK